MSELWKLATPLKGRWKLPAILGTVVFLTCLVPTIAFAVRPIVPGTPKQFLCDSTYIIVGTVVKATRNDCTLAGKVIDFCAVALEVEITEILGMKMNVTPFSHDEFSRDVGLVVGKTVKLRCGVFDNIYFPETEDYGYIGMAPGTTEPAMISKLFEGKQFIFSIPVLRLDSYKYVWPPDKLLKQPYPTKVWRFAKKEWIMDVLTKDDGRVCPTLIAP